MDDTRKKKIEEMVQVAAKVAPTASNAKAGGGGIAAPSARLPPARTSSSTSARAPASARASPRGALAPKNAPSSAHAAPVAKASAPPRRTGSGTSRTATAAAASTADEDEGSLAGGRLSGEEVEARMETILGSSVLEQLRSTKWQERVEGMDAVGTAVRGLGTEELEAQCSVLVQAVAHLPGYGDKNFQVGGPVGQGRWLAPRWNHKSAAAVGHDAALSCNLHC